MVPEQGTVRIRTVELDDAATEGLGSDLPGAVDGNPVWASPTNRLAFDRRHPGGEVGIFYMVPGVSADDPGKLPAPLVSGRRGTERLPAWGSDGSLLYVATSTCLPASGLPGQRATSHVHVSATRPVKGRISARPRSTP